MIKQCKQCSNEFETKFRTRCCSTRCEKTYKNNYNILWQKNNPEKARLINKKVQSKRVKNGKMREYRQFRRKTKEGYADRFIERIKLSTPDSDIDREYLLSLFNDHCVITNRKFDYDKVYNAYHNATAPSIDRIDSKIGYYKGNVQIVLSCINRMKNDMPNDEFLELWSALVDPS